MSSSPTLRHLLEIRQRHLRALRKRPGYLGSAIGHKHEGGKPLLDAAGRRIPAILVFVDKKRNVPLAERVPTELTGPGGARCVTDVVEGTLPDSPPVPAPLTRAEKAVLKELHEGPEVLCGGIPISSPLCVGTAGCLVRSTARNDAGRLGLLTNWHVAGLPGNRLLQPPARLRLVGRTDRSILVARETAEDPDDLESFTDASHRIDAGFVALADQDRRRSAPGVHSLGALGVPHTVDLDAADQLDLVGREVLSVGQTLGPQRGRIVAYGYEWKPDPDEPTIYTTDYLIVGTKSQAFAAPGDSGKLIVTADDERRPVALLWGGQRQGFWNARAQESWAYASAIKLVLRELQVEIVPA